MILPLPVLRLIKKGVHIPAPFSVDIGAEVDPARISGEGVVFYGGTKIYGSGTLISAGTKLGCEAPVTLSDCRLRRGVVLKGGFFESSVFLANANMASCARVREGCLLEEEANGSHTVGLKQTILFPFVTLGSLINFCDCFLAGGTSRKDHSEVGSSYIHFNYTPNQDKATPSLLGDVPRGVMLREPPIFLGGQGGLVGPVRIGFGTVIAAGTIRREDCPEGGKFLREEEHHQSPTNLLNQHHHDHPAGRSSAACRCRTPDACAPLPHSIRPGSASHRGCRVRRRAPDAKRAIPLLDCGSPARGVFFFGFLVDPGQFVGLGLKSADQLTRFGRWFGVFLPPTGLGLGHVPVLALVQDEYTRLSAIDVHLVAVTRVTKPIAALAFRKPRYHQIVFPVRTRIVLGTRKRQRVLVTTVDLVASLLATAPRQYECCKKKSK